MRQPDGDLILCDVAREDASVVARGAAELGPRPTGTIALEKIDSAISRAPGVPSRRRPGSPADAVVWEEVGARPPRAPSSRSATSPSWCRDVIAAIGILTDSRDPDHRRDGRRARDRPARRASAWRRRGSAARSALARTHSRSAFRSRSRRVRSARSRCARSDPAPDEIGEDPATLFISHPDGFSVDRRLLAGTAGMLSLSTAKSGALIGVLISVTTIPAAANIGVAAAYRDGDEWRGAALQLVINLGERSSSRAS